MKKMTMRENHKRFTRWRQRTAQNIPDLARRVFALRKSPYAGSGFHWGLEKELGSVIAMLNDYDAGSPQTSCYHGPNAIANQVILEVKVEALYRSVREAEESLNRTNFFQGSWNGMASVQKSQCSVGQRSPILRNQSSPVTRPPVTENCNQSTR